MNLLVQRKPSDGDTLPGDLFVNGVRTCCTLERVSRAIPAGRFAVQFTVSDRATMGSLWSPDAEHRLPLIVVPKRSGIRFHAANEASQLEGCIALGQAFVGVRLGNSRAALTPFVDLIAAADAKHEAIWLEVRNPVAPESETRLA